MASTTYITTHQGAVETRTTDTKHYTHASWVTHRPVEGAVEPGVHRWSESAEAAERYARTLRGKGYTVVIEPVTEQLPDENATRRHGRPEAPGFLVVGGRLHRSTCKRVQGKADVLSAPQVYAAGAEGLAPATCCKPRLPEPDFTARLTPQAVDQVLADVQAEATAALKGLRDEHGVYVERAPRLEAAKAEAEAVKAWKRTGASNGRPATPNLDALEAESAQPHKPTGAKAAPANGNGARRPSGRGDHSDRAEQARAAKKAANDKRGPGVGKRIPYDELVVYVRVTRAAHPAEPSYTAMEYAYWIDNLAFSRKTWERAWAEADQA